MRTKYKEYPEYHTSLDNFDVVTNKGLQGGINAVKGAIEVIETIISQNAASFESRN